MRVFLDTNVLVAAFISRGQCNELLEHCVRNHEIVTSEHVLNELERVLRAKLEFPRTLVAEALELMRGLRRGRPRLRRRPARPFSPSRDLLC